MVAAALHGDRGETHGELVAGGAPKPRRAPTATARVRAHGDPRDHEALVAALNAALPKDVRACCRCDIDAGNFRSMGLSAKKHGLLSGARGRCRR